MLTGEAGDPETGDLVRIQIRLRDGIIEEARFRALGCSALIAASSLLTEVIQGLTTDDARQLDGAGLAARLELDEVKARYAAQAVEAVRDALAEGSGS